MEKDKGYPGRDSQGELGTSCGENVVWSSGVILGIRPKLGWAKGKIFQERLAQLKGDNLTPSELWPQPKSSPTSGRPPFSRVDMRLVSPGMSGAGVEGQRSRKYIRVLEGHPSSSNSSPSPWLPAGSLMRGSVGKGSATGGSAQLEPICRDGDWRRERLSSLVSAPYLDYWVTTRGSFDSTSAALCLIVGPVVSSRLHLNPQLQLLILAWQRPVQRG